jgi:hypothetical protein
MLLAHRDVLPHVAAVVNYGVPFQGAELSSLLRVYSSEASLKVMGNSAALQSIELDWLNLHPSIKMYCAYETVPLRGVITISQSAATAVCNQTPLPIATNHVDMVKPCSSDDPSYQLLKEVIQAS